MHAVCIPGHNNGIADALSLVFNFSNLKPKRQAKWPALLPMLPDSVTLGCEGSLLPLLNSAAKFTRSFYMLLN